VGLVGPDGFLRHRHRGRGFEEAVAETERVLYVVHRNLVSLTHQVPMIAIEDLPEEMQRRVVGVPRDWVLILRRVTNAVVNFLAAHPKSS